MAEITTLFWDVGGVLLTNGWDTDSRHRVTDDFGLDWYAFQERHELIVGDFEEGRIALDDYLNSTVFYEERDFSREAFRDAMFRQSKPLGEGLEIVEKVTETGNYTQATLNNESTAINEHRIHTFKLRQYFTAFFSSCYLGMAKPDKGLYLAALRITQRKPEECVYIDDRALNAESGRDVGMHAIHYREPVQCMAELRALGVEV